MHLVLIGAIVALLMVILCQSIFRSGYKKGYDDGFRARATGSSDHSHNAK